MHILKLSEVADKKVDAAITGFKGTLKYVNKQYKGEGEYGPWTLQSLVVSDKGTDVKVLLKNHDEISQSKKGKCYYFLSTQGDKGIVGISMGWNNRKEHNEVVCTDKCEVIPESEYDDGDSQCGDPEQHEEDRKPSSRNERPAKSESHVEHDGPTPVKAKNAIMRIANAFILARKAIDLYVAPTLEQQGLEPITEEQAQALTATMIIHLDKQGMIAGISPAPIKAPEDDEDEKKKAEHQRIIEEQKRQLEEQRKRVQSEELNDDSIPF